MLEKETKDNSSPTLLTYGYLLAMIVLGISIGLLLYPLLRYPAVWQWGAVGLSLLLMAFTAPALRQKK
jgi:hypothetical protein